MTGHAIAYIALGSNLGDSEQRLKDAIRHLREIKGVVLKRLSSLYYSEPVGGPRQPWYYNMVVEVATSLQPLDLLHALQHIEQDLGRTRREPNTPRTIDLDVLLFGDRVIRSEALTVPHPRMLERRFMLMPLAEIEPSFVHPVAGKTIRKLLDALIDIRQVIQKGPLYEG